jgi:hypothetical protein
MIKLKMNKKKQILKKQVEKLTQFKIEIQKYNLRTSNKLEKKIHLIYI